MRFVLILGLVVLVESGAFPNSETVKLDSEIPTQESIKLAETINTTGEGKIQNNDYSPENIESNNDNSEGNVGINSDVSPESPRKIIDVQKKGHRSVSYIIHPDNIPPPGFKPMKDLKSSSATSPNWKPEEFIKICCSDENEEPEANTAIADSSATVISASPLVSHENSFNFKDRIHSGALTQLEKLALSVLKRTEVPSNEVKPSVDPSVTPKDIYPSVTPEEIPELSTVLFGSTDSTVNKTESFSTEDEVTTPLDVISKEGFKVENISNAAYEDNRNLILQLTQILLDKKMKRENTSETVTEEYSDNSTSFSSIEPPKEIISETVTHQTPRYEDQNQGAYGDVKKFLTDIASSAGFKNAFLGDLINNFGNLDHNALKLIYSLLIQPLTEHGPVEDFDNSEHKKRENSFSPNANALPYIHPSSLVRSDMSLGKDNWKPLEQSPRSPNLPMASNHVEVITAPTSKSFEVVLGSSFHPKFREHHPRPPKFFPFAQNRMGEPPKNLVLGLEMPPPEALAVLPEGSVLIPPSQVVHKPTIPKLPPLPKSPRPQTPSDSLSDILPSFPFFGAKNKRPSPPPKSGLSALPSFLTSLFSGKPERPREKRPRHGPLPHVVEPPLHWNTPLRPPPPIFKDVRHSYSSVKPQTPQRRIDYPQYVNKHVSRYPAPHANDFKEESNDDDDKINAEFSYIDENGDDDLVGSESIRDEYEAVSPHNGGNVGSFNKNPYLMESYPSSDSFKYEKPSDSVAFNQDSDTYKNNDNQYRDPQYAYGYQSTKLGSYFNENKFSSANADLSLNEEPPFASDTDVNRDASEGENAGGWPTHTDGNVRNVNYSTVHDSGKNTKLSKDNLPDASSSYTYMDEDYTYPYHGEKIIHYSNPTSGETNDEENYMPNRGQRLHINEDIDEDFPEYYEDTNYDQESFDDEIDDTDDYGGYHDDYIDYYLDSEMNPSLDSSTETPNETVESQKDPDDWTGSEDSEKDNVKENPPKMQKSQDTPFSQSDFMNSESDIILTPNIGPVDVPEGTVIPQEDFERALNEQKYRNKFRRPQKTSEVRQNDRLPTEPEVPFPSLASEHDPSIAHLWNNVKLIPIEEELEDVEEDIHPSESEVELVIPSLAGIAPSLNFTVFEEDKELERNVMAYVLIGACVGLAALSILGVFVIIRFKKTCASRQLGGRGYLNKRNSLDELTHVDDGDDKTGHKLGSWFTGRNEKLGTTGKLRSNMTLPEVRDKVMKSGSTRDLLSLTPASSQNTTPRHSQRSNQSGEEQKSRFKEEEDGRNKSRNGEPKSQHSANPSASWLHEEFAPVQGEDADEVTSFALHRKSLKRTQSRPIGDAPSPYKYYGGRPKEYRGRKNSVLTSMESEDMERATTRASRYPTDSEMEDTHTEMETEDVEDGRRSHRRGPRSMDSEELGEELSRDLKVFQYGDQHSRESNDTNLGGGFSRNIPSFSRDNVQSEVFLEFDNILRQHTMGGGGHKHTEKSLQSRPHSPDSIDKEPILEPPPRPPKPSRLNGDSRTPPKSGRARARTPPPSMDPNSASSSDDDRLI